MILGVDISTYLEELKSGAKYYDGEREIDPLDAFRANGVDHVRLRVWNDPYSENGEPYLGGTCDVDNLLSLASLAAEKGFKLLLDFHYSDFWADPGKQFIPKAWRGYSIDELDRAVYDFTLSVMKRLIERNIPVPYVQIGNEITNGMLWPIGKLTDNVSGRRGNYDNLCRLLSSGARAVRESGADTKIVLHLERSCDTAVYDEFFTEMAEHDVDYDAIGASYYPCWHGTLDGFFANMNNCKKFGKEIIAIEFGYGFTFDGYDVDGHKKTLAFGAEGDFPNYVEEYPVTRDGQARFLSDFLSRAEQSGLTGVFWWEPLWLPGRDIRWASEAGLRYICEEGKSTFNEWANQCMFDYGGAKLPTFDVYKK